jgi:hypothetical protein
VACAARRSFSPAGPACVGTCARPQPATTAASATNATAATRLLHRRDSRSDDRSTAAVLRPNPAQVTLTDYSDPQNPQDKPSSAVKVNTASSKTGVTITWTITDPPVHQLGGAVQTANATGYVGKWVNAKQVSATASTRGGNHLDFAVICFNDSRYPAPPSGSFGPGGPPSMAPAFRRH